MKTKGPFFTSVTAEREIIGAWFAKVFLDGISQQTNVEATWSESKQSCLKIRHLQKMELQQNNTRTNTTMFACVLSDIC